MVNGKQSNAAIMMIIYDLIIYVKRTLSDIPHKRHRLHIQHHQAPITAVKKDGIILKQTIAISITTR